MPSPTLEIARREFLENVLSWRFVIALVLSSLILVTSFVALATAYKEDEEAFRSQQQMYATSGDSSGHVKTLGELHRHMGRPNVLSIFVGGVGDEMRSRVAGLGTGATIGGARYEPQTGGASPTNARFDPLDLGFVGAVVLTFLAVMFSYDAISGEKERGTLKLLLSNPVPRDAVLLGKYLGGMASVLVPFLLSLVLGLAVLAVMDITLGAGAWIRLGVILGVLILLLSAFYLVGLMVSAMSKRSATSLLGVTLIWLILVFGAGNAAGIAAKAAVPAPTSAELYEKNRELSDRMFSEWEAATQVGTTEMNGTNGSRMVRTSSFQMSELMEEIEKEREAMRTNALQRLDQQVVFAESVGAISPVEAFRSLSSRLARSDYWSFRDLIAQAEVYNKDVEEQRAEWIAQQGPQPPEGGGATMTIVGPGGMRVIGGGAGFEAPDFHYKAASVSEELGSAAGVRDLLVLLAYNVAAFLTAYVAFLRYDVR